MLRVLELVLFGVALVSLTVATGVVLWRFSPTLARWVGAFLILSDLYRLALAVFVPWVIGPALRWLSVGLVLWLFGHWAHMARYGWPRSMLAARVFALPGLRALVPAAAR